MVWFCVALVLGFLGWIKSLNPLLILAYTMGVLLILNGYLAWRHGRRVMAKKASIFPVFVAEDAHVAVAVRNVGSRPATVVVEDAAAWHVSDIAPDVEVVCECQCHFTERGRFKSEPPRIRSGYPFGLLEFEYQGESNGDVVVLPQLGKADPDRMRRWVMSQAAGVGRSQRVLRRVTLEEADVRGVRPYRAGDSVRSVHWRSSARRGELMVREYDSSPVSELFLVVEPWLPDNPSAVDRARMETALSLATTIVWVWSRCSETRVTLVVAAPEPIVLEIPEPSSAAREALTPLAEVTGGPRSGPIASVLYTRTLVKAARIVVSSRPGSQLAASLSRATGRAFIALDPIMRLPWYLPPDTHA